MQGRLDNDLPDTLWDLVAHEFQRNLSNVQPSRAGIFFVATTTGTNDAGVGSSRGHRTIADDTSNNLDSSI